VWTRLDIFISGSQVVGFFICKYFWAFLFVGNSMGVLLYEFLFVSYIVFAWYTSP